MFKQLMRDIFSRQGFTTYVFTCDPELCDALVEITCKPVTFEPTGKIRMTCPCGREMNYVGKENERMFD